MGIGQIKVQKMLGKYSVVVDNLTQSGGLVRVIWVKTTKYLNKKVFPSKSPKTLLFLGLGSGGSIADILNIWPKCQITGIEIDPIMIDIGKKYFHLNTHNNLKVINSEAIDWLERNTGTFDVIYIDLYQGKDVPKKANTRNFYKLVKKHLNPNGVVVFNRLTLTGHKNKAIQTKKEIASVFRKVYRIKTPVNMLLAAME